MRLKWTFLLSLVLYFVPSFVWAIHVSDLDQANWIVADRSPQALNAALPHAMQQVLIKISGDSTIIQVPGLQNELMYAKQYLQSYSYTTQNISGKTRLLLHVKFDGRAVKKLLQHWRQPIWPANRPRVLLWLQAVKNNIASTNYNNNLTIIIKDDARLRGLPVVLPIMDLQDQELINGFGGPFNLENLQMAAKRYQVSTVLAGRLSMVGVQQYQAQWLLYFNGLIFQWSDSANNYSNLLTQGVDKATDTLAKRLAINMSSQESSKLKLHLSGIHDFITYVMVNHYLKSLPAITDLQLIQMGGTEATWLLQIASKLEVFRAELAENPHFRTVKEENVDDKKVVNLYYTWQPKTKRQ